MAKLEIKIGASTYPVEVTGNGTFLCDIDGESFESPTYNALKSRVQAATTDRRRCEIPASELSHDGDVDDVVLIGRHASNNHVLYQIVGQKGVHQLASYSDRMYRRLTPEERQELKELRRTIRAAQTNMEKWQTVRKINAGKLVDAALAAAVKTK